MGPGQSLIAEDGASCATEGGASGDDRHSLAANRQAKLLYSKSKVYLHPSSYMRDNIPGFISIVQVGEAQSINYLLAWIPEASIEGTPDFDSYVLVELSNAGVRSSPDSEILVSAPAPETTSHAFSIPVRNLYSLLIQAPTLSAWFGSVTFNLYGGSTLPPLYFHDEESRSTVLDRDRRTAALGALGGRNTTTTSHETSTSRPAGNSMPSPPRNLPPSWGGEALLSQLRLYSRIVRSQLEPQLFLVNPSKADIEVHSTALFDDEVVPPEAMFGLRSRGHDSRGDSGASDSVVHAQRYANPRANREGVQNSILHQSLLGVKGGTVGSDHYPDEVGPSMDNLTFSVLNSFSRITRGARQVAQQAAQSVLSHPLAKPILKNIPEPIANFANAPGEISRLQETAGVGNYDSARVYLANWARDVAEEGEKARRIEVTFADPEGKSEDSEVGAFEVLASTYKITRPKSSRAFGTPIVVTEWAAWFDDSGKLMISEEEGRRRIFQRGLEMDVRKDVWPFLLDVYPWTSDTTERKAILAAKKEEYERLKASWKSDKDLQSGETFAEESHRIEIDCRRTDRTHPMFMPSGLDPSEDDSDVGGQFAGTHHHLPSNRHVMATQEILTTYVFTNLSDVRNYVQGMSDLLSPIYVVNDGEEAMAFWQFETQMKRMKENFTRDQKGMKRQLSDLQALIALMDPQLHQHLEQTGSLNLFFCFRWILCSFKRELSFESTLKLWENLWTDRLGVHFHLFVALAILEAHRDVIIRYLREFDEVLQYVNKLSGTLHIEAILGDAEVLYLTFRKVLDAADVKHRVNREAEEARIAGSTAGLHRRTATIQEEKMVADVVTNGKSSVVNYDIDDVQFLPPVEYTGIERGLKGKGKGSETQDTPDVDVSLRRIL